MKTNSGARRRCQSALGNLSVKNIHIMVVFLYLCALSFPTSTEAAEFSCAAGDTACLIARIDQANDNGEANTINLGVGTYTLTKPFPNKLGAQNGPSGLPTIFGALTIKGGGSGRTIIQRDILAQDDFRIFDIGGSAEVTLNGLTIQGGLASGGGGIFSRSTRAVTLSDVSVVDNHTAGSGGGILHVGSGTLTVIGSCICRNHIASDFTVGGGGISVEAGLLTIINSRIIGNSAGNLGPFTALGFAFGGGIFAGNLTTNIPPTIFVTIIGSTIANNFTMTGGGISLGGPVSGNTGIFASVRNSTISDNEVFLIPLSVELGSLGGGDGAGISNGGSLELVNVTISNNKASVRATNQPAIGGGISNGGRTSLRSTLVVNNLAHKSTGDSRVDCVGSPLKTLGHNMDSDGSCALTDPSDKSRVNDPLLDPQLLDNGGLTETHALLMGSLAIDAIPPADCIDINRNPVAIDQRGVTRPFGSGCDIGAFEFGVRLVNNMVSQDPTKVVTSKGPPVSGAPAGTLTIRAPFQNGSTRIMNPVFEVIVLTGGNILLNARSPGGVGARLVPNVAVLEPGQTFTVDFVVGLQTLNSFAFFVNLLGVPSP